MLAVVEDDERLALPEVLDDRVEERAAALLADLEDVGDLLDDQRAVPERRELHEPDAVGEPVSERPGRLHREPRLPASARAAQGDEADLAQEPADVVDLPLAADEAAERDREVMVSRPTVCSRHGHRRREGFLPLAPDLAAQDVLVDGDRLL